ncbi:MAG: sensor histidine kinase [Anaerolineales bacterium]
MSQQHLDEALQMIDTLAEKLGPTAQNDLAALRQTIATAQQHGEGQDADQLRATLEEQIVENSKFISVMVHEIRKPLTSIRGYADMLGKNVMGELNEMQSQFVETIRKNTISMETLVSDISDISKLHSGRLQPAQKMEMYKNIAMQLEKDMAGQAQEREVALVFDTPEGLPLLNTDTARITQALRKLIDNAIKYTPAGTGQVIVRAENGGDKLHVHVEDNGIGITAEEQARLGELFFRGDQEQVTSTKGYGMGLPIAMACVSLIGGELAWQSTPGQGTIFTITLPAMQ